MLFSEQNVCNLLIIHRPNKMKNKLRKKKNSSFIIFIMPRGDICDIRSFFVSNVFAFQQICIRSALFATIASEQIVRTQRKRKKKSALPFSAVYGQKVVNKKGNRRHQFRFRLSAYGAEKKHPCNRTRKALNQEETGRRNPQAQQYRGGKSQPT